MRTVYFLKKKKQHTSQANGVEVGEACLASEYVGVSKLMSDAVHLPPG